MACALLFAIYDLELYPEIADLCSLHGVAVKVIRHQLKLSTRKVWLEKTSSWKDRFEVRMHPLSSKVLHQLKWRVSNFKLSNFELSNFSIFQAKIVEKYTTMISRIYGTKLHEISRKMLTEKPSKRPTATELVKLFSDSPETLN